MKKENLLGQRFGKLTVIAPAKSINSRAYWLCRCDCGKEKTILAGNLKDGKSKSCGCASPGKHAKIKGKRFGKLTVIEYMGSTKHKDTLWKCRCDCGNEIIVQNNNLHSGHTTSCGCNREEIYYAPEKRIEGLKKSPNTGRFETNIHAKNWVLIAPNGTVYKIKNLTMFIRNNSELFEISNNDEDVNKMVKRLSVAKSKQRKWRGWIVKEE